MATRTLWPMLVALALATGPAAAQEAAAAADEESAPEASPDGDGTAEVAPDSAGADLLSDEELQTLVAPVALYPDTLLIQVLVAATQPLEVVKADRLLDDNPGTDPAELKPEIEAEDWDPSVEVLATAFPDVIGDMATHIEWTETVGDAMLAQSDDVMDAVQVMRSLAVDSGQLVSGEQQTVSQDSPDDPVVITPTDPQVVYVPQYQPDNVWGDALVAGAVGFGTFALMDAIFDDDDDWDDYWGCRNCGGWGGGPIIRDPDIDIDVDGDVNIGNRIDRDDLDIGDRDGDGIGWRPDPDRGQEARDKIAAHREDGGGTRLPIDKPGDRTDALREKLSDRTGAADIARPGAGGDRPDLSAIQLPDRPAPRIERPGTRPAADRAEAVRKTADRPAVQRAAEQRKPQVAKKAVAKKPAAAKVSAARGQAIKKKAPAHKARAGSAHGKAKKLKRR